MMHMGHMMALSFDRAKVAGGRAVGVGTFDIDVRGYEIGAISTMHGRGLTIVNYRRRAAAMVHADSVMDRLFRFDDRMPIRAFDRKISRIIAPIGIPGSSLSSAMGCVGRRCAGKQPGANHDAQQGQVLQRFHATS
jgi:hypothetical protein